MIDMKTVSSIESKYLRFGLVTAFTRLVKEMSDEDRDMITKNIQFLSNEIPVLCFFPNNEYWWILTTSRLILNENKKTTFISFDNIKQVTLSDIINDKIEKRNCKTVHLVLKNDLVLNLNVEQNTWHAVYNILKFVRG